MKDMSDYNHLSNASSLCGNCTEVCPVKINIHELLLQNRHQAVQESVSTFGERMAWKIWRTGSLSRGMMNMGNGKMKNLVVNKIFKGWTVHRHKLDFSKKTFNEMWNDRQGEFL